MSLAVDDLHKRYGDIRAVDGVSFALAEGETLALLGPSGCGKSTLLRLLAGLEPPDRGRVRLGDRDLTRVPPQKRRFGVVFQDYALFPHLDVERNVAFGLVELGWAREARRERVAGLLSRVGLAGFERRRVQSLSGGQQQRVALARALAPRPEVLLLDEPLSNLDLTLREGLVLELQELLSSLSVQAVYVTHDQGEAVTVAERVAVMRAGRLVQLAGREELLTRPRNAWVARFLGHENVFEEGVPGAERAGPALLRADLVRFGGGLPARVARLARTGLEVRAELEVPSWGRTIVWRGYDRELPEGLGAGSEAGLDVPEGAWVGLEPETPG